MAGLQTGAKTVVIFGGAGFVGRYIARRFARAGWRVRVAVRRPHEAEFVRPYGVVGQVAPVQANIRDDASVMAAVQGVDLVVNCVGILYETPAQSFDDVHHKGAARIAQMAKKAGVPHLVHLSAIGASKDSESAYQQSKAAGEKAVLVTYPEATILRPSIIFGAEDEFFNRFANMARFSPVLPLVGADTRFQPVYVDDVAAAAEAAGMAQTGGVFELGGAQVFTMRELMQFLLNAVKRKRLLLGMSHGVARVNASVFNFIEFISFGIIGNKMITKDQIIQLGQDNVVAEGAKTLADLDIQPTAMQPVVTEYLKSYRPHGQYDDLLKTAE